MKKQVIIFSLAAFLCGCFITSTEAAGYLDVLHSIRETGNTLQSVNSTLKNTVEHTQRFGDRQDNRKERKRDKVNAEQDAERAYYDAQEDL